MRSKSTYPIPDDEVERLNALHSLDILDTPPDQATDMITACVSQVFNVPIALGSLVDSDRQWFRSCVGLEVKQTDRSLAFCAHAIMRDDVLCVPDARLDDRFAQNPLVLGPPFIRFYAGAPLVTDAGYRLGTLCVIGTEARAALTEREQKILRTFAAMVVQRLQDGESSRSISKEEASYLKAAKENAEQTATAKGEFLAMVSHELKTPLNIILGYSDLLQREIFGPLGSSSYKEYSTSIYESGEHLQTMIGTILDFASADRGEIILHEAEFGVAEVVDKVLRLLGDKARRFDVTAGSKPLYSLPHIQADKHHVMQMLLNVIGNAIKFNKPGGTVVVSGETAGDGSLSLSVVDTGIGISAELIDRLNSPFVQIDGRLSRSYEGIGLGLAVTRRLIELHGGVISVSSRENEGSCVSLTFPASRVAHSQRGSRGAA